jgi:purine-binding chemotaxis protein CheW
MKEDKDGAFDWEDIRQRIAAAGAALSGMGQLAPEVVQEILERRAAQLAEVPLQEEEGERIELALIRLGSEIYGLEVRYVFDIRPVEQITRVPRVPDWVAGVVNLRGRILSVLDLQRFFGLPPAERDGDGFLVVVETPDVEVALLADDVLAVEVLPTSQVQDVADTIRGLPPEYVRGVAELGGNGDGPMMVVLDLPALLADKKLIVREEII